MGRIPIRRLGAAWRLLIGSTIYRVVLNLVQQLSSLVHPRPNTTAVTYLAIVIVF
jgi:hypothetical protein